MVYVPENEEERKFLEDYDASQYDRPSMTVDLVCFTIRNGRLSVLLVERGDYPYRGAWALPGGFVNKGEDLPDAAVRELLEETHLDMFKGHLEQLGTYGAPGRDPRDWITSVSYLAFGPNMGEPIAGSDASDARWWAVEDLGLPGEPAVEDGPRLAFDHAEILKDGLARVRSKLEYTPLASAFVNEVFTIPELRRVYEAVWGTQIQPANFSRKVTSTPGFVVPESSLTTAQTGPGRRASLYRRGEATLLHPALLSPSTRAGAVLVENEGVAE